MSGLREKSENAGAGGAGSQAEREAVGCPLCGHRTRLVHAAAPGYRAGSTFSIHECSRCLASFARPLAAEDSLYDLIYANIRLVPGYCRYHRYAHEVLARRRPLAFLSRQEESYWAVARLLAGRRSAGLGVKVLEVGCGLGYFTYALDRAGYCVKGLDVAPEALARARKSFGGFYEAATLRELRARGETYDVVVMNQLIEHVPDVHQLVSEALSLLTRGGELMITTPNKSAYPAAEWQTELPPVHLWWLGEEALSGIARHHGCGIRFVDFSAFHRSFPIPRLAAVQVVDRSAVFDPAGNLLTREELPAKKGVRDALKESSVSRFVRGVRYALAGRETWRGARGRVCACALTHGGARG